MIASLLALVVLSGSAGGANRTLTCEPGPELSAALAPLFASAESAGLPASSSRWAQSRENMRCRPWWR